MSKTEDKPVVLEPAVAKALLAAGGRNYTKKTPTRMMKLDFPFSVETPSGVAVSEAGTFLAIDSNGNLYPVEPSVVEASYRPARSHKKAKTEV